MTDVIDSFSGKYRFLSNFYPVRIVFEGKSYYSTEHAYQAAKTEIAKERVPLSNDGGTEVSWNPAKAKDFGTKKLKLRPGWDLMKIGVMEQLLRQKFAVAPFRNWLLETGDAELIEGNHWGDKFWGVCNGIGQNHLGTLLMKIRSDYHEGRT